VPGRSEPSGGLDTLLRRLAPSVLATVARRHGDFGTAEDAVQEALLAAATRWPAHGVPDNPVGWLVTVASRRWVEGWRQDTARRQREVALAVRAADPPEIAERDDSLLLLVLCCHPALTPVSQVGLTLRAVGGLTTAEIGRALLVPEATVGQRISRAKARIRGTRFTLPGPAELPDRIAAVRQVLYLIFTEGHTASSGRELHRVDLAAEAIRLTRLLYADQPDDRLGDGETAGLLALMLLTDARRPARLRPDGTLAVLADQDRSRWDRAAIAEGIALLEKVLPAANIGAFAIQAAIAAVHAEAPTAEQTDWPQILGLYDVLRVRAPGGMVELNRVVALAMVHGPAAGLAALAQAAADPAIAGHHRTIAVRAHLLERRGELAAARAAYLEAAAATLNLAERRHLEARAAALAGPGVPR